jgi:hypothetical protein
MHRDGSRTSFVATLDDVRQWAGQTSYRFVAWVLSVIGFAEVFSGFLIERYKARQGNEGEPRHFFALFVFAGFGRSGAAPFSVTSVTKT